MGNVNCCCYDDKATKNYTKRTILPKM